MRERLLRLVVASAFGLAACVAQADIYTWTDAKGTINVSNVAPPEGVKVTKVMQDSPPMALPPRDLAAEAARQAEMQVLAARVNQLENEAEFSRRQIAAMPAYAPPQSTYSPQQYAWQYIPQYVPEPPQPVYNGCDPGWQQCGAGWSPWFTPTTVVVVGSPGFRRPRPAPVQGGGRKFPMQTAARGPVGFSRH